MNDTKIYQKMKNKSFLNREKNIKKMPYYNYKKLLFKKNNDLESFIYEEYKDVLKNQF